MSLSGRYRIQVPVPEAVRAKQPLLARLRDHYSHIDERALGQVKGKQDPTAMEAFEFRALFTERILTDGHDRLGLDAETTTLCLALRDYLVAAWSELVNRAHQRLTASGN